MLGGAVSMVYARLTGHLDPYHGGTMLFDAGMSTLFVGLALLAVAFFSWPRRWGGTKRVIAVLGLFLAMFVAGVTVLGIVNAPRMSAESLVFESKRIMRKDLATGLEVYFIDHGFYPSSLAELLPRYVRVVPVDPCTGGTYKYEPQGAQPKNYRLSIAFPRGSVCASVVPGLAYTPDTGLVEAP